LLCCVLPRLSRKTSDVFDTLLQKQQSKWGNTTGPSLSGLFYCVASCSMILLNKIVLSTYNFSAGISLMLYQVIWCGGYNRFNWQLIVTELTSVSFCGSEPYSCDHSSHPRALPCNFNGETYMEADQSLDSGESYFHRDANNWNVQVRPASHTLYTMMT
jgi:hypothetical protein